MFITCLDLEGVLIPEIWIAVAKRMKIPELEITTRDEPDYDKLMKKRIEILNMNNITLNDIQTIIKSMTPLLGAKEFLDWLQEYSEILILTDSYREFAKPMVKALGNYALFCHNLEINEEGKIVKYNLRLRNMKKITIQKLKELNFVLIAVGDSYNDIEMLKEADFGILFRPPENVKAEYPQFPSIFEYAELKENIKEILTS
ncbi:MAG: bifunctional phosphoserine phosphatase/homoserine phosphotransferase ThrH [Promethearchaeota archaeon]|nr:MAG: bifunctional phosphoserine phosphatase/homoserine phosphotransferase ThrH [Candidatus Lokiarchaeota archaeon]